MFALLMYLQEKTFPSCYIIRELLTSSCKLQLKQELVQQLEENANQIHENTTKYADKINNI